MSKISLEYKPNEIAEMMSVCSVRKDCNRSCNGCDYNHKGHKICRDMLVQYNNMSRPRQISIIVSSKNM